MSKPDLGARIIEWIDERIQEILAAPRMWGASLEAVELQVLTLLEVRAMASNIDRELAQPRRVLDAYVTLLSDRFKNRPSRPLYEHVGDEGDSAFVAILKDLSAHLTDLAPAPEQDFFSRSYVGIELLFKPGQFLSAQTVTGFYEDFRRATRSLARVGSGKTGRVERSIEIGTDFELESVQITPLNGVPARAQIALGAPYGQLDMVSGERVRTALEQILDVAQRADSDGSAALHDFGRELDAETRSRILVQTLRLLPRGGIDEVRIGGTYISRAPVRLRRVHAPKVMAAVAEDTEPTLYDHTTLIRAIDLDRGLIIHGKERDSRIPCYVSPEDSDKVTRVGVIARIVGKRYEPRNGQSFVIAEEIEIVADRVRPRVTAHNLQQ